jgi:hypothetical protein
VSLNQKLMGGVSAWGSVLFVAIAARVALFTGPPSLGEVLAWIFVASAPIAIFLVIFRSAASSTIAGVLYDADHTADAGRKAEALRDARR